MPTLPLIAHRHLDAPVAWRSHRPISARHFLDDVEQVAALLPAGQHVLNLCSDRYHFTVALAACIVSGRVSMLPSTRTTEMIGQMQRISPDIFCISDQDQRDVDLPNFRYPDFFSSPASDLAVPQIACDQLIAKVFTSGSTGLPVAHVKHWGSLVRNAQAEGARLGVDTRFAILGTVPAQHMYGLESTVLLPLQCGATLHAGHPFYPADICAELASLPHPRMLVTTPYHLRTLLIDQAVLPRVDQVLSATAPLSQTLSREAEARFGAPLHEIYGCTETGQIATRRPATETTWHALPDIVLSRRGADVWAEGGHIEIPTPLSDVIELLEDEAEQTRFLLHGRHADQVNIAGKRSSLAYLNHQLNAIPGVLDGVFVLPEASDTRAITRLSALVVAPGLAHDTLIEALRERIDPVFLPRPLLFVEALPRNATGKLPSHLAQALLDSAHPRYSKDMQS